MPFVVAVSGYKNSGKSTLCRTLLKHLRAQKIPVGYIKHTCERIMDELHGDTGHAQGEGFETLLWGADGVRFEGPASEQTQYEELAARFFPDARLVLLEGAKSVSVPKIWVCGQGEESAPDTVGGIFAVYDRSGAGNGVSVYGAGEEHALAARLAKMVSGENALSAEVTIGGRRLPMKDFVADFVRGGVLGMLASLKKTGLLNPLTAPVHVVLRPDEEGGETKQ